MTKPFEALVTQNVRSELAELIDAASVRHWLAEFQNALAFVQTPDEARRALKAVDLATEYVRKLKLGITVEMEVVETAIFTELLLGQTLDDIKKSGGFNEGGRPPKKPIAKDDRFSLKQAGISLSESAHAQRFVEYIKKFDLASLRDLVREHKLKRNLSRSGIYKTIDQAIRRNEHEAKDKVTEPGKGPYDVIIADPPWQYDEASTESRAIENQYRTATLAEIKEDVPEAAEKSVLFLWATAPKLLEAIDVLQSWQFGYRTNAVWDKQIAGMGFWFRGQHELLLVGTRGEFPPPEDFLRVSSVFSEKRSDHSRKPECVFEWIEKVWPEASKLEMYSRRARPGWAIHGNEVGNVSHF